MRALSRLMIGALILGGDELMKRLRLYQREIEAQPRLGPRAAAGGEATIDLLRHMAIGLYARGQIRVARGVRGGVSLSRGVAGAIVGAANRLTDNRLARPLRRSVGKRLMDLGDKAALVVDEGRREEEKARLLAGRTMGEVIDELLDYLSTNPAVADLIREQVAQQGVGLANIVGDSARRLAVSGDDLSEVLVRRVLLRKPRRELPPSPLLGRPLSDRSDLQASKGGKGA